MFNQFRYYRSDAWNVKWQNIVAWNFTSVSWRRYSIEWIAFHVKPWRRDFDNPQRPNLFELFHVYFLISLNASMGFLCRSNLLYSQIPYFRFLIHFFGSFSLDASTSLRLSCQKCSKNSQRGPCSRYENVAGMLEKCSRENLHVRWGRQTISHVLWIFVQEHSRHELREG